VANVIEQKCAEHDASWSAVVPQFRYKKNPLNRLLLILCCFFRESFCRCRHVPLVSEHVTFLLLWCHYHSFSILL